MVRARAEAARRGTSIAALLREGLDRLLDDTGQQERRARAKAAVGGFRSGRTNTSVEHDEALAEEPRW